MTKSSEKPTVHDGVAAAAAGSSVVRMGGKETTMHMESGNGKERPGPEKTIGPDVQDHLGRKLKASYDELVRQPVPDKFRELLEELERREKQE
jgi:Anti-sigma factor NepR